MEQRAEARERPRRPAADDIQAWSAEWRDSATACKSEFARWMHAPRAERAGANARFVAALDREEAAAAELALAVALGPSWTRAAQRRAETPDVPALPEASPGNRFPSRRAFDTDRPVR
jgi:hypothetical protein